MPFYEIYSILSRLAARRPIFHSEADFQHALAWEFHISNEGAQVRLEKQIAETGSPREYLDLLVHIGDQSIAIELKYKTRLLNINHEGEQYSLRNQSAQDIGRHDFIKDIGRLERYVKAHEKSEGIAVLLTNDPSYWTASKKLDSIDVQFRIHEGRILQVGAAWGEKAAPGTTYMRSEPLKLFGSYKIAWQEYSSLGSGPAGKFRCIVVHVADVAQSDEPVAIGN